MVAIALAVALCCGAAGSASAAVAPSPAPGVPENGRAWELLTSPESISATLWVSYALAADGSRFSYATIGPLPGSPTGHPLVAAAMAQRTDAGWLNSPYLSPFTEADVEPLPLAFSPDLKNAIWSNKLPPGGPDAGEAGLFRRTASGDALLAVDASFLGASTDLDHVFFSSERHLAPADSTRIEGSSIYESVGSGVRIVDVSNDGTLLFDCGSNAISADGRRIFFTSSPGCEARTAVFMRAYGSTTVEISASRCDLPDCGEPAPVAFAGATPDGMHAFLVTQARLTDDDLDSEADLYRYDVGDDHLQLISVSWEGQPFVPYPRVDSRGTPYGTMTATGDGSYAYSSWVGPDGTDPLLFVTAAGISRPVAGVGPIAVDQLAANGRYAILSTTAQLTVGDTDQQLDLYRYDAETSSTVLISAGPRGGNGPFEATTRQISGAGVESSAQRRLLMSEDGSRIFFQTAEQLLAADRNESVDVYEWANGTLGLISAGTGQQESSLVTTTPDGRTAVFRTADSLVPIDVDGGDWDFYAARVGGGFASNAPPCVCAGSFSQKKGRAQAATGGPAARKIRLRSLGAEERRRIVASGWITLLAEVPQPGKLSVIAQARLQHRRRVVAATSTEVTQVGPARLRMRLLPAARRQLARGGGLDVRLTLRLSGLASPHRVRFELRASR